MCYVLSKIIEFLKKNFDTRYVCTSIAFLVFISATLLIVFTGVELSNTKGYVIEDKSKQEPTSVTESENGSTPTKPTSQNENFSIIEVSDTQINEGELVIVNKEHECMTDGFDLLSIMENKNDTYKVADYSESLNSVPLSNLNNLMSDFYSFAGPTDIYVSCGYRSYETQQGIYENSVAVNGADYADGYVSKPGYSEHQTGYVFDLALYNSAGETSTFTGEGTYSWIEENCAKYGFVLRYLEDKVDVTGINYEPWHFRYIGQEHALYVTENNLALEEYLDILKEHSKETPLQLKDIDGNVYFAYYETQNESNSVNVPKNKDYTISGDNISGYIITYRE